MLAQQVVNGLMLGAIYVLVGVAFTMTIGVLNFLNFSIPAIFMLGGMLSWGLIVLAGLPWLLSVALGVAAGGLASLVVERFTYRWLRSSHPDVPLISSVGFLVLFEHLVILYMGAHIQRFPVPFGDANIRAGGLIVSIPQLCALVIAVSLVAALDRLLRRTQLGRCLRAIAESPDTARLLGVDTNRIVPALFIISGMFTALGGILFAANYLQVSPFIGNEVALKGVAAMIIGGMGNIWGAVLGGLLIGVLESLSIHFFGGANSEIVIFGSLLLFLCIRPTGLYGDRGVRVQRV
jgi:branched-chain amino acid transport system permease protein